MIKMLIDRLDPVIRDILAERYTAAELVDFLGLDTLAVIDAFEQDILDNIEDFKDNIGMTTNDETE
jgi:hypothetical protein